MQTSSSACCGCHNTLQPLLLLLLTPTAVHVLCPCCLLPCRSSLQLPGLQQLSDDDVWLRRKAPNTLVLHGRAGNCIGDMGAYDYFTLGGPYSVRGYSPGELGACRWALGFRQQGMPNYLFEK